MRHEDSAHFDDQQKINEHIVYLHRCAKLSLPVFANSLSGEQRKMAKEFLRAHLKESRANK